MFKISPSDFEIKKAKRGKSPWIVIYKPLDTHGHFKHRIGCETLIKLLCSNTMPKEPYFRECAKRLLEDEFDGLVEKSKLKYRNNREHRFRR